jgi:uncharacterized protein (TIGR02246 family)
VLQEEGHTMSEAKELIAQAFTAWEAGDSQAVFKLMADDLQWTIIGTTEISGTYESREAFLTMVNTKLMPHFAGPLIPTVQHIFADGDRVAAQFSSHAPTHDGPDYDQNYCWVMQIVDGQIKRGTAYLDTALIDRVTGHTRT